LVFIIFYKLNGILLSTSLTVFVRSKITDQVYIILQMI